uniref:Major coat protein L-A virus domain-containing protein n=1 Tax=Rhodosorus marinus TaxID=101924 RepID=A0A7S2Z8V0_9RHOD|mmetsp:Transcript_10363/g.43158  ORF Transcript_10363/g.43158 Transcript_10363/m.43158 type:complete len:664 (+) Transcript_10363:46-2037(+)
MFYVTDIVPGMLGRKASSIWSKNYKKELAYSANVHVDLHCGKRHYPTSYSAYSIIDLFGKVEARVGPAISDYGGFNNTLLDVNGILEPQAFMNVVYNQRAFTRDEMNYHNSMVQEVRSSEVGLMFNLIRQWYILKMDLDEEYIQGDYYNDGHISISKHEAFGVTELPRLTPSRPTMRPSQTTYNEIDWPGIDLAQAQVMYAATGELKGSEGYGITVSTPALTNLISSKHDIISFEGWEDVKTVEKVIDTMVERFRLVNAFETALYLVAQIAANFRAPIAESVHFRTAKKHMIIPEFLTFRCGMPHLMAGLSGATRPSAIATYRSWKNSPDSLWLFSAVMNAAAEFKSIKSQSTDFDVTGLLENYSQGANATGGLGKWCVYASSALGKEIYYPEPHLIGVDFTILEENNEIIFTQVGPLVGYRHTRISENRVKISQLEFMERQPIHPKVLFLTGILPDSKVGRIPRSGELSLKQAYRPEEVATTTTKSLGAYMLLTRLYGYNVTAKTADGVRLVNWSDNASRLVWTPGDLEEFDFQVRILDLQPRSVNRTKPLPPLDGQVDMNYEISVDGVFLQYGYNRPISSGTFMTSYKIEEPEGDGEKIIRLSKVMPGMTESVVSDFWQAPRPMEVIAPGEPNIEGSDLPQNLSTVGEVTEEMGEELIQEE